MLKKLLIAAAVLVALVVGGTVLYVQVIRDDPAPELEFTEAVDETTTTTSAADAAASDTSDPSEGTASLDGTWEAIGESVVGYRVIEDFVGGLQNSEAVGRTSDVEGSITLSGTTVDEISFTADLTTLESDESRRDSQVQGRILNTAEFPTATFTATGPIALEQVPDAGVEITAPATGELTLHGVTREVTFEVRAKHSGDRIEIVGQIPVEFADYDIPDPSNPFVSTRDNGTLEVLLVLERA